MSDIVSRLSRVTAPTVLPLHLNEVKARLHIEPTDNNEDADIMASLRSAVEDIDGRDGWLGRALCTQTWDYILDRFPGSARFNQYGSIFLPLPPMQSVTSISYTDTAGDNQTLAASKYKVSGANDSAPARIAPAFSESWPTTRDEPDAVTVRFVAGYTGTTNTQNAIPVPIRNALLLSVQRDFDLDPREQDLLRERINSLLIKYQVWNFA